MVEIFPLQTKEEKLSACEALGAEYIDGAFVYATFDGGNVMAVCQFTLRDDSGEILSLSAKCENEYDTLLLLLRSTLSFIELCGRSRATIASANTDADLIKEVGFSSSENGTSNIELR